MCHSLQEVMSHQLMCHQAMCHQVMSHQVMCHQVTSHQVTSQQVMCRHGTKRCISSEDGYSLEEWASELS